MCCWPFLDVTLEDGPKSKKEEEKAEYVLVSDQLTLHPGVSEIQLFPHSLQCLTFHSHTSHPRLPYWTNFVSPPQPLLFSWSSLLPPHSTSPLVLVLQQRIGRLNELLLHLHSPPWPRAAQDGRAETSQPLGCIASLSSLCCTTSNSSPKIKLSC